MGTHAYARVHTGTHTRARTLARLQRRVWNIEEEGDVLPNLSFARSSLPHRPYQHHPDPLATSLSASFPSPSTPLPLRPSPLPSAHLGQENFVRQKLESD